MHDSVRVTPFAGAFSSFPKYYVKQRRYDEQYMLRGTIYMSRLSDSVVLWQNFSPSPIITILRISSIIVQKQLPKP